MKTTDLLLVARHSAPGYESEYAYKKQNCKVYLSFDPEVSWPQTQLIRQYPVGTDIQQGPYQTSIAHSSSNIQGGVPVLILQVDNGAKVGALLLRYPDENLVEIISSGDCAALDTRQGNNVMYHRFSRSVQCSDGRVKGENEIAEGLLVSIMGRQTGANEGRFAQEVAPVYVCTMGFQRVNSDHPSEAGSDVHSSVPLVIENRVSVECRRRRFGIRWVGRDFAQKFNDRSGLIALANCGDYGRPATILIMRYKLAGAGYDWLRSKARLVRVELGRLARLSCNTVGRRYCARGPRSTVEYLLRIRVHGCTRCRTR